MQLAQTDTVVGLYDVRSRVAGHHVGHGTWSSPLSGGRWSLVSSPPERRGGEEGRGGGEGRRGESGSGAGMGSEQLLKESPPLFI